MTQPSTPLNTSRPLLRKGLQSRVQRTLAPYGLPIGGQILVGGKDGRLLCRGSSERAKGGDL